MSMAWSGPPCRRRNGKSKPVVAFNAHVDTSPETTGKNVKPQVIRNYAGGDIVLPGDRTQGHSRGRQSGTERAASARRS